MQWPPPIVTTLEEMREEQRRGMAVGRQEEVERDLLPKLSARERAVGQYRIAEFIRFGGGSVEQLLLNIRHTVECLPPGVKIAGFDAEEDRKSGWATRELRDKALNALGLTGTPTSDEIRSAYKRKARETHPDTGGDSAAFRRVNDAYNFLLSNGGF